MNRRAVPKGSAILRWMLLWPLVASVSGCGGDSGSSAVAVPNQTPIASDDAAVVSSQARTLIDVLANDRDPNGGQLQIELADVPLGLVANVVNGQIEVRTGPDLVGATSFTYRARDPGGLSATAAVSLTILPQSFALVEILDAPFGLRPVLIRDGKEAPLCERSCASFVSLLKAPDEASFAISTQDNSAMRLHYYSPVRSTRARELRSSGYLLPEVFSRDGRWLIAREDVDPGSERLLRFDLEGALVQSIDLGEVRVQQIFNLFGGVDIASTTRSVGGASANGLARLNWADGTTTPLEMNGFEWSSNNLILPSSDGRFLAMRSRLGDEVWVFDAATLDPPRRAYQAAGGESIGHVLWIRGRSSLAVATQRSIWLVDAQPAQLPRLLTSNPLALVGSLLAAEDGSHMTYAIVDAATSNLHFEEIEIDSAGAAAVRLTGSDGLLDTYGGYVGDRLLLQHRDPAAAPRLVNRLSAFHRSAPGQPVRYGSTPAGLSINWHTAASLDPTVYVIGWAMETGPRELYLIDDRAPATAAKIPLQLSSTEEVIRVHALRPPPSP